MLEDYDIYSLLLYLLFATTVQCIWLRKQIFGIFDPLLYYVASSAFAITLSALVVDSPQMFWRIVLYFAFFWTGFTLACRKVPRPLPSRQIYVRDTKFFLILVVVGVVMMVILNLVGWLSRGIPLLSENPSIEKVDSLTGGLGFIRRFNWGVGVFVLIGSLYWFLAKRSVGSFVAVTTVSLMTAMGGSKSALLPLLFAAGLYTTRPFVSENVTEVSRQVRRVFPVIGLLGIAPVFIVLMVENEDLRRALAALVTRLLYFGDVMLYWGQEDVRSAFESLGPIDYLGHLFNGITGFLRISEYDVPLGTRMVNAANSGFVELESAIGPNTPFYVKGELFFGPFIAPLYAFGVGIVLKWVRSCFFQYSGRSLTHYTVLATIIVLASALPVEDSLFIVQVFDFAVFFLVIYLIALIIDRAPPNQCSRNVNRNDLGHAGS